MQDAEKEMTLPDVATQVWIIAWVHAALVIVVCYQSYIQGRLIAYPTFGLIEMSGWLSFLFYRFWGMWGLSEQLELAKTAGLISDHLTLGQWINILGTSCFVILIIVSKALERRAIRRNWGV